MQTARRRLGVICALGFSSGLPLALTGTTLQAWLTESGVDITTIGLFSLVGFPYVLKFLWSPLLDRLVPPMLGRRRGWMLMMQISLALLVATFALLDPRSSAVMIAVTALCLAFASATQDIAIDAYRAEALEPRERGMGAGLSVMGYRIASLISGAVALFIADQVGFRRTFIYLSALVLICMVATVTAKEPRPPALAPRSLRQAAVEPFKQFFERDRALMLLALVSLYKIGDAFAGSLVTAFLVRELGFSLSEVGAIYKGLGLGASVIGAVSGGALMYRLGLYRALMVFAVLQALTNFGFMHLALSGKSYLAMACVIGLENISGGMGTAAFVALLMALCDARYTATQFALLTAVASIGRVLAGPPAGYLVDGIGWPGFFFFSVVISVPAMLLLYILRSNINEVASAYISQPIAERPTNTGGART